MSVKKRWVHYTRGFPPRSREISEAIDQFGQAMRLRPAYAEPYVNLGKVLITEGKLDEAIGWLGKALEINPDMVEARRSLDVALNRRQFLGGHPPPHRLSREADSPR